MSTDSHTHDGIEYGSGCPICLDNIRYQQMKENFLNWLDEQGDKTILLAEIVDNITIERLHGDNNE